MFQTVNEDWNKSNCDAISMLTEPEHNEWTLGLVMTFSIKNWSSWKYNYGTLKVLAIDGRIAHVHWHWSAEAFNLIATFCTQGMKSHTLTKSKIIVASTRSLNVCGGSSWLYKQYDQRVSKLKLVHHYLNGFGWVASMQIAFNIDTTNPCLG